MNITTRGIVRHQHVSDIEHATIWSVGATHNSIKKLVTLFLHLKIKAYNCVWERDNNSILIVKCIHDRFLDPLMFGDYPSSMRSRVGNRLPKFSPSEAALVKGSLDFVGINHYTTFYARDNSTNLLGALHSAIADSGTIALRKFQTRHYQAILCFII